MVKRTLLKTCFSRLLLPGFAGCLGLWAAPSQAQQSSSQGSWVPAPVKTKFNPNGIPLEDVYGSGTTVYVRPGSPTITTLWKDNLSPNLPMGGNVQMTLTQQGTLTLWLQYVPPDDVPNQVPPNQVPVRVHVTGGAVAKSQTPVGDGGYTRSVQVSVGGKTGSAPSESEDPDSPGVGTGLQSSLDGYVLKVINPVQRSDGKYYLPIPVTIDNRAHIDGPRYQANGQPLYGSFVNTAFGAQAEKDNRSVKLTRNNQDRFELGSDGSWTTYGDTTYSYQKPAAPDAVIPDTIQENYQVIRANPSGGWSQSLYGYDLYNNPIYIYGTSYSWALPGVDEAWTGRYDSSGITNQLMPVGQLVKRTDGKWGKVQLIPLQHPRELSLIH